MKKTIYIIIVVVILITLSLSFFYLNKLALSIGSKPVPSLGVYSSLNNDKLLNCLLTHDVFFDSIEINDAFAISSMIVKPPRFCKQGFIPIIKDTIYVEVQLYEDIYRVVVKVWFLKEEESLFYPKEIYELTSQEKEDIQLAIDFRLNICK